MAVLKEYRPVLAALEKVYAVRQEYERVANKDPRVSSARMESVFRTEFARLEARHPKPFMARAKGLAFHFESPPPRGQALHDAQLDFHGFESHAQVDPHYRLHYLEGLADIAAALAISNLRSTLAEGKKGGKKGRLTRRLQEKGGSLQDIMARVVQKEAEKPELNNQFNLLVAIARVSINELLGRSAGPERIAGVRNATYKAFLRGTGYGRVLSELRERPKREVKRPAETRGEKPQNRRR